MLKGNVDYKDLGGDYLDRFLKRGAEQRLVQRLRSIGYEAGEWGGWSRLSDDGLGQNNPNRSEDPLGAGCCRPDFAVSVWPPFPDTVPGLFGWSVDTQDGDQLVVSVAYAGSKLQRLVIRKVPSDMHIFQPYWGKPAVRNDRGDRGNVGIIRSPVRATILLACGGCGAIRIPTTTMSGESGVKPVPFTQNSELNTQNCRYG
jgi:hypothetical protein